MRCFRWFLSWCYPVRHYDLTGAANANLYRVMSPGNGIRVRS